MHLPMQITSISRIKHPPWSTLKVVGEHVTVNEKCGVKETYDLLFLDSKQFCVQTVEDNNVLKVFSRFGALDVVKEDIVHILATNDKSQSSIGMIYNFFRHKIIKDSVKIN